VARYSKYNGEKKTRRSDEKIVRFFSFVIVLTALAVLALRSTVATNLPPLQPVPGYLRVFPEAGQAVYLSVVPQIKQVTSWGIPGYVCTELDPASLLQPGDSFEFKSVEAMTTLTVDGQEAKEKSDMFQYDLLMIRTYLNGQTATTSGPYIICWQGPTSFGYHIASFTFRDQSYTWWYELK
jgi:hypothetical protein